MGFARAQPIPQKILRCLVFAESKCSGRHRGAHRLAGCRQASCFAGLLRMPWIEQCNTGRLEVRDVG
jgi:hypothetical protein